MKANGKADLYFHAYFWEQYLRTLGDLQSQDGTSSTTASVSAAGQKKKKGAKADEGALDPDGTPEANSVDVFSDDYPFMNRVLGLSATLSKVIVNIKKFPFHEKMYQKYANEFGQRNTQKKMKYLEEI